MGLNRRNCGQLNKNRLLAPRPDGGDEQLRIAQFRNGLEIRTGFRRQLLERLALLGRREPAFKLDVNRHALGEDLRVVRLIIVLRLAVTIRDADFDGLNGVEAVEVRDGEVINAVDHRRVTRGNGIDPTAATRASGGRAELAAHAVQ